MRLNEWQLAFENYLLSDAVEAPSSWVTSLQGGPTLDVSGGLAIYHNAYRGRLLEALRGDYPALVYWVGDAEFEQWAVAYIRQCPSAHFSLRLFGAGFAGFLSGYLDQQQAAPLVEMATLEWAFTLAFDAPSRQPLTCEEMTALPASAWPDLQVELVPSAQWVECRFNTLMLWQAYKAGESFVPSERIEAMEVCLIWRSGQVCQYRSLGVEEASALQGMNRGWSFAQLCSALEVTHEEGAALQAVTWFKDWLSLGFLNRRTL